MKTNTHHTVVKGDVAVAAVVFDLTKRGYIVSTPLTENSPYDLVCDVGDKLLRLQVKFRVKGVIPKVSSWMSSEGTVTCPINRSKFDYYVIVNEDCTNKIVWPTDEELKELVWGKPSVLLAEELGVSDSAIGKRCKARGITKPPRRYWANIRRNIDH